MGIILLLSLMTIPAVIANSLTKDYRWMTLLAAITAVVGNVAGFVVSYMWDIPTGSCIIFTLMAMLICVKILSLYRNRLRL
jgi:zinc transport system permease protein